MFWAFDRVQEPGDFLRARHNGEFLRLPAGWDIVLNNPRSFEGDCVDEPECGNGDRNRAGRQSPLLDEVKLPSPDLMPAQPFGRLAEMAGEPGNLLDVNPLRLRREVTDSAYPRSCGGEAVSLATPLQDEQRHTAPPHRLAVELSGEGQRVGGNAICEIRESGLDHTTPAKRVSPMAFFDTGHTPRWGSRLLLPAELNHKLGGL